MKAMQGLGSNLKSANRLTRNDLKAQSMHNKCERPNLRCIVLVRLHTKKRSNTHLNWAVSRLKKQSTH
jgi:hypothetical protein